MKYFWSLVAIMLLSLGVIAQTTGTIQGTMVDNNNEPLPGATVEISSPALQGVRTTTSDVNGFFIFRALPVGMYKLKATMQGFGPLEQADIQVFLDKTVTLKVQMQPAFEEVITITGESPLVDVTSTTMGLNLTQEIVQDLPAGRTYQSLAFKAPSAVEGELGSNPSVGGASAAENRYLVDGIDTSDPAFGTYGTNVTYNFIQEVEVKTGGYEAEYGGAMGGIINVVTKSGSNEFKGELFGYFTDDSLTEKGETPVGGSALESFKDYDYGMSVGGKIIQDKLWYFVALNPVYREDEYLLPIEGYGTFKEKREGDPGYGALKLNYSFDPNNSFVFNVIADPKKGNDFYGDYFIDVSDREDYLNPKDPGSPITTDMNRNRKEGGYNYGGTYTSILSPSLMVEVKAAHHETKRDRRPVLNQETWFDWSGMWTCYGNHTDYGQNCGNGIIFGGAGFDEMDTQRFRDHAKAALSWYIGNFEVKAGVDYKKLEFTDHAGVNGSSPEICVPFGDKKGTYDYLGDEDGDGIPNYADNDYSWTFLSLEEFATLTGRLCDANGDGVADDGIIMPPRHGNRWFLYDPGFISYMDYYNRNYQNNSVGNTTQYALFLQTAWKVFPNFTLKAGVRADSSKSEGNMTELGVSGGLDFGFGDMISPRVGFIWDFANNGRSKLYGHYGKFFNDIPLQINVRAFGNEQYWFYYYQYPRDAEGNPTLPSTQNPGLLQRIRLSGGAAEIVEDIKPAYEEEVILGGEYELMPNLAVGLKGIYRSISDVMEDYSFDGGSTYVIGNPQTLVGDESACVTISNELEPPEVRTFCFVKPVRFYRGVELSLDKRFSNNWQLYASLLWSKSEGNYGGLFRQDNGQLDPFITSLYDLPQLLPDTRGLLPNDREWQFKLFGSYRLPLGLTLGFDSWFISGQPLSKLGSHIDYGDDERFVGPRGSFGRGDNVYDFSLHAAYPFKITESVDLKLILDIFNVFNFQKGMWYEQTWSSLALGWTDHTGTWDINRDGIADGYEWDPKGCDLPAGDPGRSAYCDYINPEWGKPTVYQNPRSIRLGFSLSF